LRAQFVQQADIVPERAEVQHLRVMQANIVLLARHLALIARRASHALVA
jgi:hypothetical protein